MREQDFGITGEQLKIIAILLMVFDHIHQMFLFIAKFDLTWMSMLGRLVLPIFLFMCAEGFHYTHDRKKYLLRLGVSSVLMGIANQVIMTFFPLQDVVLTNNAFCTMFVSAVVMYGIEKMKDGKIIKGLLFFLLPALPMVLSILAVQSYNILLARVSLILPSYSTGDGGMLAVALCVALYLLRQKRWAQYVAIACVSLLATGFQFTGLFSTNYEWMMVFSIFLIMLYNGKRGGGSKYFFYVFYPSHIFALYFLAYYISTAFGR